MEEIEIFTLGLSGFVAIPIVCNLKYGCFCFKMDGVPLLVSIIFPMASRFLLFYVAYRVDFTSCQCNFPILIAFKIAAEFKVEIGTNIKIFATWLENLTMIAFTSLVKEARKRDEDLQKFKTAAQLLLDSSTTVSFATALHKHTTYIVIRFFARNQFELLLKQLQHLMHMFGNI